MADTPRITYNGEDVTHEYSGTGAIDLEHHMKPVRLSIPAINQASRIIPADVWKSRGICAWLLAAAQHAFDHMPTDKLDHMIGPIRYVFEFDADAPVLKAVRVG